MEKPLVLSSFLKQRAKQLKKEKSLSHHQALDEAAKELDYFNYKGYRNLLEAKQKISYFSKHFLLRKISLENDMSKKTDLATPFVQNPETSFQDLLDIFKLFQHSEETLQLLFKKSNIKTKIQQYWLDDYLNGDGAAEIYGLYKYYVAKDLIVKNLKYKMNGDVVRIDGEYDLTIKFGLELEDESDREKHPHFQDRLWWGDFEITIDRNKEITVLNASFSPD